jgi:N-carbamoylputrescine amidase
MASISDNGSHSYFQGDRMSKFKVGLIQMSIPRDTREAQIKAEMKVREAAAFGAQVICLPELYRTPYFCQKEDITLFNLAEEVPGPSFNLFRKLSVELDVVILVPIFEKRAPGLYHNSVLVINPDEYVGLYRKMHIPDDPNFYEKFYFTPGDLGFKSFRTKYGNIGTLICWDQWYPEAARLTALAGASLIVYPTAIGWLPQDKEKYGKAQYEAWKTIQKSHAIANGVYVAAVNRIGTETNTDGSQLEFWGRSFVCNPEGQIIAEASVYGEENLITEIDTDQIEFVRREWPFLRDRRIDAFEDLTKRYGI